MAYLRLAKGTLNDPLPMYQKSKSRMVINNATDITMSIFFKYFELVAMQHGSFCACIYFCTDIVESQFRKIYCFYTADDAFLLHLFINKFTVWRTNRDFLRSRLLYTADDLCRNTE